MENPYDACRAGQFDPECGIVLTQNRMYVLAVADDMTGALEVGAKFSEAGFLTTVSAQPTASGDAQVLVLDTETRHLDPESARERVCRFIAACGDEQPLLVYKKTDSTLRGNIGAELHALVQMYPQWSIGYAPAYPALGRTVRSGILYVNGRAVAETEFAYDQLNPVRSSSVGALLDLQIDCRIFDGEVDEHLLQAACAILSDRKMRIAAGPAAFAGMIARMIDIPRRKVDAYPCINTCLVLNGSRHQRSALQVQACSIAGWRVVDSIHGHEVTAAQAAAANSRSLVRAVALDNPDAIFVFGGDTVFAVIRELGFPPLSPIGEVVAGIPVTRIALPGRIRDLFLITKAGGFGDVDVLARVHAQLSGDGQTHAG